MSLIKTEVLAMLPYKAYVAYDILLVFAIIVAIRTNKNKIMTMARLLYNVFLVSTVLWASQGIYLYKLNRASGIEHSERLQYELAAFTLGIATSMIISYLYCRIRQKGVSQ